ncbi:GNAT family N-acetyltransferase [Mucilaginibacter lutimaris]|uniref:GNAT family N-acetyltransferase n=1 Tax=Mucilaginibacter lutimaris TaxID=931629 RepID=A0ABW2ZBZ5_9SPHI
MSNILHTSLNISLRRFTPNDASFIFDLLNSPTWKQFIGDRNILTPGDAVNYILNVLTPIYIQYGFGPWLVVLNNTHEAIGLCGLFKRDYLDRPDLGFAFMPGFEGRGLAYEACRAALTYIIQQYPIDKLYATTSDGNLRSQRLLERCGFAISGSVTPPGCNALLLYTLNLK